MYFIVYTTPGTTPKMALEFLKGDARASRARGPNCRPPTSDGRIPYVVHVSDRELRARPLQRARAW